MSRSISASLTVFASALLLAVAGGSAAAPNPQPGFDASGMDRAVAPGDDFFSFTNDGWERRTMIPADRNSVGLFADLRPAAEARLRALLDEIAPGEPIDTQRGKLRALYRAFLDERAVATRGVAPLRTDLGRIAAARTHDDLAGLMGEAHAGFGASIFDLDLAKDVRQPDRYAVYLGQSGLGLPGRDYYLLPRFAPQLAAYTAYAARLLGLAGWSDPDRSARDLVAFETRVARASWSQESERDPLTTYNPGLLADLDREAPGFAWKRFLEKAGLSPTQRLVLTTNTSVSKIARIYAETPLETLKAWQAFRTADAASPYLPDAFIEARTRKLGGQLGLPPRWQRGVRLINTAMGSAAGELYVQRFFKPESEATIKALVDDLRVALVARIDAASWMNPDTRAEARRKLARLEVQVGRPKRWIDYSTLIIRPDDLYGDVVRTRAFDWQRRVRQLAEPWNKSDWRFWPQDATAYNENGQLIFTAAMLQPPFFDPKADAAINYGAIGSVIGHELSHQFDDQGRMSDARGQLRDWWTPSDAAYFTAQATRLAAQYSALQPLPGLHVNGDLTLGENIADLGGVSIAFDAYHLSLAGRRPPLIDGFTGDQRFFLSWAQGWREKTSDDETRRLVATDVHSPAMARVNGVVRNIDGWYGAWRVRPGQRLYIRPEDRVRIW